MRTLKKILAVACITLASAGCPGPTVETPDASTPKADAAVCKAENKCGTKCCKDTESCVDGACVVCECATGQECGTDACGNSCGTCDYPQTCNDTTNKCEGTGCLATQTTCGTTCCDNATQSCKDGACVTNKTCGANETGCGPDSCCTATQSCVNAACVDNTACAPGKISCADKCCDANQGCQNGACVNLCAAGQERCADTCCTATQSCVNNACVDDTTCDAGKIACGTLCCDDATQVCAAGKCETKGCPATTTECGAQCCTATQTCDTATNTCKTPVSCTATQTKCGNACCDNATQTCDTTNNTCKAKTQTCNSSTEITCGTACCVKATQFCDSANTCQAKATCNADETACGTDCCTTAIEFCKNATTSTCATLATCNATTETVCYEACCLNETHTCDATTKACKEKPVVKCTADATIASVTVNEEAEKDEYGIYVMGPIPTTDGTDDLLSLELYDGMGAFANGLATGSYQITGEDLNYKTCGLCVLIYGDVDFTAGTVTAKYLATGGGVEITTLGDSGVVAKLVNVNFEHVNIAPSPDFTSTPHPDGCKSTITAADITGTLPVACDPLDIAATCQTGEGCYYDGSDNVCATPTVQGESGDDCNAGTECKPGLDCFGSAAPGTCLAYCSIAAPTACTGLDQCSPLSSTGDLGVCSPCPTDKVCGTVCCSSTQKCDAAGTACEDIPTCDVFNQASCTVAGEGCYFDRDAEIATCQTAGTKVEGDACTADAECTPGLGCVGGYYNKCAKWCHPGVTGDCTGTFDTCDEFTPTVGGCY